MQYGGKRFWVFDILLALISGAPVSVFAQRACTQVDALQQTRCQIENAFQSHNLSLVQRLFDTNAYADVDDLSACGHNGYGACALSTGDIAAFDILFSHKMNPSLSLVNGTFPQLAFILDSSKDDVFISQIAKKYVDAGVDMDSPMLHTRDGGTLRHFILSKCSQPHTRYPKYNMVIRTVVEAESSAGRKSTLLDDMHNILASSMGGGDPSNCKSLLDEIESR